MQLWTSLEETYDIFHNHRNQDFVKSIYFRKKHLKTQYKTQHNNETKLPKKTTKTNWRQPVIHNQMDSNSHINIFTKNSMCLTYFSNNTAQPNNITYTKDACYIYRAYSRLVSYIQFVIDKTHYSDVIMGAMASQITSRTIVCSTVYSRRRSKKT